GSIDGVAGGTVAVAEVDGGGMATAAEVDGSGAGLGDELKRHVEATGGGHGLSGHRRRRHRGLRPRDRRRNDVVGGAVVWGRLCHRLSARSIKDRAWTFLGWGASRRDR